MKCLEKEDVQRASADLGELVIFGQIWSEQKKMIRLQ